jgi:hypothetical protein
MAGNRQTGTIRLTFYVPPSAHIIDPAPVLGSISNVVIRGTVTLCGGSDRSGGSNDGSGSEGKSRWQ